MTIVEKFSLERISGFPEALCPSDIFKAGPILKLHQVIQNLVQRCWEDLTGHLSALCTVLTVKSSPFYPATFATWTWCLLSFPCAPFEESVSLLCDTY